MFLCLGAPPLGPGFDRTFKKFADQAMRCSVESPSTRVRSLTVQHANTAGCQATLCQRVWDDLEGRALDMRAQDPCQDMSVIVQRFEKSVKSEGKSLVKSYSGEFHWLYKEHASDAAETYIKEAVSDVSTGLCLVENVIDPDVRGERLELAKSVARLLNEGYLRKRIKLGRERYCTGRRLALRIQTALESAKPPIRAEKHCGYSVDSAMARKARSLFLDA